MAPPAQPDAMQPPPSLAQLDSAARALRGQLKQQKNLSKNYFVDCVLAELQHGVTLNATLFALFKKLTLLVHIPADHEHQFRFNVNTISGPM